MAAPNLRIVRRPRGGALTASVGQALTAASAPVTDPTSIFKAGNLGRRADWQDEAWQLYDRVGELGFYIRWRARSCSRVKLVASEIDPDTGQPTGSIAEDNTEGTQVAAIVRAIAGGPLGQAQLVERSVQVLGVPGEYWCAILQTDQGERWLAVSRDEIKRSQKRGADGRETVAIDLPEGGQHQFDQTNGDGMFRVWNPHARRANEADSPVRSNLDPLREIVRTTQKIANADKSRLTNNGLLIVPNEASLPAANAPVSAGKPGAIDVPAGPPQKVGQSLQHMIVAVNEQGAKDPDSQAAVTPVVIGAPAEHVDKVKHVTFGKDVSDTEIRKRNDAIGRLAMGLDMEPDQLLGLGDTNHWNGRLLSDNDVQMHVKPVMKTVCGAIYDNVIRPMLQKMGIDPARYTLDIDASDITADPDLTDEVKDAHEKGAASNATLARVYGLPEDGGYDLTTLEGFQQLARDKLTQADPANFAGLLRDVMPLLDKSVQSIDFPEPVPALPPGADNTQDGQDDQPADDRATTEPDTEGDQQSHAVRATAAAGMSMALELMVTRALDIAGKRRVKTNDTEQRARLRNVEAADFHRYMPPVAEHEVPRLIKGWDAGLDALAAKYRVDAAALRIVVERNARQRLTAQVVDA